MLPLGSLAEKLKNASEKHHAFKIFGGLNAGVTAVLGVLTLFFPVWPKLGADAATLAGVFSAVREIFHVARASTPLTITMGDGARLSFLLGAWCIRVPLPFASCCSPVPSGASPTPSRAWNSPVAGADDCAANTLLRSLMCPGAQCAEDRQTETDRDSQR